MTMTPEAKQDSDTPRDRNLDGCEEFISAMLQRDLPPSFKALSDTPEIWPNNWGQDVAMAAFMVHKDAERIADLERQLAAVTAERDALRVDAENCRPLTAWMDNVIAARLGKVALAAGARTDGMAESVDFGLRLRRLLEESGFEVRVAAIDAARAK